jgi:hypothetical protein
MIKYILYTLLTSGLITIGIVFGYLFFVKHLRKTINYQRDLIDKLAKDKNELLDKVKKAEYNNNIKIY